MMKMKQGIAGLLAGAMLAATLPMTAFADDETTYTLTFDRRMASDVQDGDRVAVAAGMVFPTNPTADEGYEFTFAGWYTGMDGTGVEVTNAWAEALTADTTCYAKWTYNGKTVRTEPLDCTALTADTENDEQGWKWEPSTKSLTLDGATFYVMSEPTPKDAITLPGSTCTLLVQSDASATAKGNALKAAEDLIVGSQGDHTLALMGGVGNTDPDADFAGLSAEGSLFIGGSAAVGRLTLSAVGAQYGICCDEDISIDESSEVTAYGDGIGVTTFGDVKVKNAVLIAASNEDIADSIGVSVSKKLTVENGEVHGSGTKYAVAALEGISAPGGSVNFNTTTLGYFDAEANPVPDEDFISGTTGWFKQGEPGDVSAMAAIRQESRTLYYDTATGKMYDSERADTARNEITSVTGWEGEGNVLSLEDFELVTTANKALVIEGDCTLKLRGDNIIAAKPTGEASAWTDLHALGNLTIENDNDPAAALYLMPCDIKSTATDSDVAAYALVVTGDLIAQNIALDIQSGTVTGPNTPHDVESAGIGVAGDMLLDEVKMTLVSGEATDDGDRGANCISCGIESLGKVMFNHSDVAIYTRIAGDGVCIRNVMDTGELIVNGGKLETYTSDQKIRAVGLEFGAVTIMGDAAVVTSTGARDYSYGIQAKELSVDNAFLSAEGETAAILLDTACTLTDVTAKGNNETDGACNLAAEWKKAADKTAFTLVGSGAVCKQIIIDATAPVTPPTPDREPEAAPTATPAPAVDTERTVSNFTVNAWVTTGGTVSPIGVATYKQWSNAAYTMTPAAGYRIVKVVVDGVDVGPVASYTLSGINRNHEIGVYFDKAGTGSVAKRGNIPQTSDEAPLALWVFLMGAALFGAAGCTLVRHRKKQQ